MEVDYQVDMLVYGTACLPADWVYDGKYKQGEMTANTFGITAVRGGGRNILIDCGSNMDDLVKQAVFYDVFHAKETFDSPQAALASIGLVPEDISDVLLTHAHLDHMGALELFPNARFYVEKDELAAWEAIAADPMMAPMLMPGVADAGDLKRARSLVEEGRMTEFSGDVENIVPGIDAHVFPHCHSVVDTVYVVNTPDGPFVDVGDIASREVHLTGLTGVAENYLWQSGCAGSEYLTMMAYKKILELAAGEVGRVIIRHDSTLGERRKADYSEGNVARYKLR